MLERAEEGSEKVHKKDSRGERVKVCLKLCCLKLTGSNEKVIKK